jgi:aspartate racemase
MKTIGLLGGMSWESTETYYRKINLAVNQRLQGLHSAKLLIHSFDFAEIEELQMQGHWKELAYRLSLAAKNLQDAGAELMMIGTNTMHKVADSIEQNTSIPLLHIADATGQSIAAKGHKKVGLLGTRFTMEESFYRDRIEISNKIATMVPDAKGRELVNRVIYQELCKGQILSSSKQLYIETINNLASKGAEAIILGCTEIGLLVKQDDVSVPLFDTTAIHAEYAVDMALNGAKAN